MSLHIWRNIYYFLGWDYPKDLWEEQQRWNKYHLCQEIKQKHKDKKNKKKKKKDKKRKHIKKSDSHPVYDYLLP